MSLSNGCCEDSKTIPHPFEGYRGMGGSGNMELFDAKNPIPDEVTDTDALQKLFEDFKLVPFASANKKTGHAYLTWLLTLSKLSPTNAACIEKIKNYVVGGKAKFVRAEDPEYNSGLEGGPMTASENKAFSDALKETVIFEGGVIDFHKKILGSAKATGNAFVECSISTINGQTKANLRYLKVTDVMYKVTAPGEIKVVVISPVWEDGYLKKNKPVLLPVAPDFVEENGVKKAVFHLKVGDGNWYGRPDSQGSDVYKYREVQDSIYVTKQSAANFVGQIILEVEDDDAGSAPAIDNEDAKKSGFKSFVDRLTQNFTQKGKDPQSMMVTARPQGARPMSVFQVKPNTNERWYEVTGKISESKIIMSHGVTLRFMGLDVSNGFSSDAFVADYVMNVEPTINETRTELMVFTNKILSFVWDFAGKSEMNQFSLTFSSPIQSQIEQYKSTQTQQENGRPDTNNTV